MAHSLSDEQYMRIALGQARRGLGTTYPNPSVGCVLTKEGVIIASGVTGKGGRPHGEKIVLEQAGENAKGATLYVTLEPCSHYGKTAPCTERIIEAGVKRVVVACKDPYMEVNGKGIAKLKEAGVEVTEGVLEKEAAYINQGFFSCMLKKRPLISLKFASSMDGKIAHASGQSKWLTGDMARKYGHYLRANHDAVMVGVDTVLADDPDLTCRIEGLEKQSAVRVVLDTQLRTPASAQLFHAVEDVPVWLLSATDITQELKTAGAEVMRVDEVNDDGRIDITAAVEKLAERGITRLLVEGGSQVAASLFKAGLVDQVYQFLAGKAVGAEGKPSIAELALPNLEKSPQLTLKETRTFGQDQMLLWQKN